MREHGVRRLAVVDSHDRVIAVVAFDDLLRLLGRTHREMGDMIDTFPVAYQDDWRTGTPGAVGVPR